MKPAMLKLTYLTQADAQTRAASLHTQLKATNSLYRASCDLYDAGGPGGTARWDVPKQDVDKFGVPLDTKWHVTVDNRVRPVMTKAETGTIVEWTVVVK